MKKLSCFIAVLFLMLCSMNTNAQTQTPVDFFVGKWDMLVIGTPGGDSKLIVSLSRKDGKLEGIVLDTLQKDTIKITKIEETPTSINIYFTAQGYDVNIFVEKKDDDHVAGNLMSMFDAKGERRKEIAVTK